MRGILKTMGRKKLEGMMALYMNCDGWKNPCGHIDKYSKIREEAKNNGLNKE